ncbi:MAG: transposase [Verrucomicrobia bacterium]|nr:transposase [Verrucomicrobiota bacterium]
MEYDGVPWNNNAAERAIRHLAIQRKISGAFTAKGANHYLRLLAISQTCRFQEKSFLGFLLSGLKDVDAFAESRRGRRRLSPTSEPKAPLPDAPAEP